VLLIDVVGDSDVCLALRPNVPKDATRSVGAGGGRNSKYLLLLIIDALGMYSSSGLKLLTLRPKFSQDDCFLPKTSEVSSLDDAWIIATGL
jgi:hypothetical protein